MPYLPQDYLHDTAFPRAWGKDLHTQMRMVEERWRRFFPRIEYYQIKVATTQVARLGDISGEPGTTRYDTLYGESVDPSMATWDQPHLSAEVAPQAPLAATDVDQFEDPVTLHARVQRLSKEYEHKLHGTDEVRDLLLVVPQSSLDRLAVIVSPGDKFIWDGDWYLVMPTKDDAYWKNSNNRLFRFIAAEHLRIGS